MYVISICNFLVLETHVLVNDWIVQMHTILTSVFALVYSMGNKISFFIFRVIKFGKSYRKRSTKFALGMEPESGSYSTELRPLHACTDLLASIT